MWSVMTSVMTGLVGSPSFYLHSVAAWLGGSERVSDGWRTASVMTGRLAQLLGGVSPQRASAIENMLARIPAGGSLALVGRHSRGDYLAFPARPFALTSRPSDTLDGPPSLVCSLMSEVITDSLPLHDDKHTYQISMLHTAHQWCDSLHLRYDRSSIVG
jgi:hypothetical protein